MRINKNKQNNLLYSFFKLLVMTFKAAPVLFIITILLTVIEGISFGAMTLFLQRFFDSATLFITQDTRFVVVIISLAWYVLIFVCYYIISGLGNFIPKVWMEKTQGKLSLFLHDKLSKIPPVFYEDTNKLDDINKAEQGKNNAVNFVFSFMIIFSFHIPYFIFMSIYLFTLKPILVLSIIFVFLPTFISQILRVKVFSKMEDKSAPIRREYDYYEKCLVAREYYKETRLLGGFNFFKKYYLSSLRKLNKLRFKAIVKTNLAELSMKLFSAVGYLGILYLLFDSLMKMDISLGAFAAVFSSIGALFGVMGDVVNTIAGKISSNWGTIQNYLNFLNMEERKGKDYDIPEEFDIKLENLTFAYPNSENNAVSDISLTIRSKETIAIVGENGSGKTTLVRLITGLYNPDTGRVCFDEMDCCNINLDSLYSRTSAVFQNYRKYQMSLKDNIIISREKSYSGNGQLDHVCQMAGLNQDNKSVYPYHYDTMLSREFDGVDLSGGEWQRVAIARGLFREHSLIILDEPTAAIDPIEETNLYKRFAEISKEKTAVIVTHRLGAAKFADRIIVMREGQIAEIGTHDDLISNNGEYARMYKSQQKWYIS